MGRELVKWKGTGMWAWKENNTQYEFRVSPKFKSKKKAQNYEKPLNKMFENDDTPTKDRMMADSLYYPNFDNLDKEARSNRRRKK